MNVTFNESIRYYTFEVVFEINEKLITYNVHVAKSPNRVYIANFGRISYGKIKTSERTKIKNYIENEFINTITL